MKLVNSTCVLRDYFPGYGTDLETNKKLLATSKKTGFKYIDYSFYRDLTLEHLLLQDDWEDTFKKIREYADSLGLQFVQAHSAGGNPIVKDDNFDILLESTIRSIKACQILGIKNTVVHQGYKPDLAKEDLYQQNLEFFQRLFPAMEQSEVSVLIENGTRTNSKGSDYIFCTGESLNEFLAFMAHPLLGACWDTGHGNMTDYPQYENITALGKNLKAVHIADNLGVQDNHFAPYFGTVNMDEIINALLDMDYQGYFTFECDRLMIRGKNWPAPRKEWPKDTRLYEVPLELKIEAEKLLCKIGEYMLRKYDCFEE